MLLRPGAAFDRYVIEALLGEGGMGRVYCARDTRLQRRVALKVLRSRDEPSTRGTLGSDGGARLLREARAAAALDHPNAVAVFDVGEFDGVGFIAMELLEGRVLRDYVGDASVPLDQRLRWLTDVARALAAAHQRGLVHRDIKPENVMVRADGVVKVLDFGIARRIEFGDAFAATEDGRMVTAQGDLVGTPMYMAPEQLRGDPVDGRTDQFAWGVLAYELLAGTPPWDARASGLRLVSDILAKEAPPLDPSLDLPAAVAAAVRKTLAKQPRERFATMEDVVDAIESLGTRSARERGPVDSTLPPPPDDPGDARLVATHTPRSSAWLAPVALLAVVAGVAALRAWPARATAAEGAAPTVDSESHAGAAAITDAPLPDATDPRAAVAYRAGMQSLRDASVMSAVASLRRAIEIDPSLAAAHLRLAWLYATQGDLASARGALHAVRDLYGALTLRDRALLEIVEAHALAQPPDPPAAERLAVAAAQKWPGDAEVTFLLARYALLAGDSGTARDALDRAIAIDPRFALVWWARAIDAEDRADIDGAIAAYDECAAVSHAAASCLRSRSVHSAQRGDCARLEQDARRLVGIEPDGHRAYEFLARALAARDKPLAAVRGALEQRWNLLPQEQRKAGELSDRARLAMLEGDFAAAESSALALRDLVSGARTEIDHAEPVRLLLDVYGETGDAARAGAVADDFRRARDAWIASRPLGDSSLSGALPTILAAARRAGKLPDAAYASLRAEWLHEAEASLSPLWRRELWVPAFAEPSQTADEAREALAALPDYAPLPPPRDLAMTDAATGKVFVLAGRADEALPYLRRAAATCLVLDDPTRRVRAELLLGEALEPSDARGTCEAYARVIARWGAAKPRSRTADEARRRSHALHCPE